MNRRILLWKKANSLYLDTISWNFLNYWILTLPNKSNIPIALLPSNKILLVNTINYQFFINFLCQFIQYIPNISTPTQTWAQILCQPFYNIRNTFHNYCPFQGLCAHFTKLFLESYFCFCTPITSFPVTYCFPLHGNRFHYRIIPNGFWWTDTHCSIYQLSLCVNHI